MSNRKLNYSFYRDDDVARVARNLLGKVLCTQLDNGTVTSGIIVETEAYSGRDDRACHANDGKRTSRTEVMYRAGGVSYVYLCYGIHHLFNVVTNRKERADAVLVRAVEPLDGVDEMLKRRNLKHLAPAVTSGPGRMSQALGITTGLYGADLAGDRIWIEDRDHRFPDHDIVSTPRIGVEYAGEHSKRAWRFIIKDHPYVSG